MRSNDTDSLHESRPGYNYKAHILVQIPQPHRSSAYISLPHMYGYSFVPGLNWTPPQTPIQIYQTPTHFFQAPTHMIETTYVLNQMLHNTQLSNYSSHFKKVVVYRQKKGGSDEDFLLRYAAAKEVMKSTTREYTEMQLKRIDIVAVSSEADDGEVSPESTSTIQIDNSDKSSQSESDLIVDHDLREKSRERLRNILDELNEMDVAGLTAGKVKELLRFHGLYKKSPDEIVEEFYS
uniref:DEK_C domain-containing protein n=1 Tax=Parastrongyloides trichosuri TaxID=131310 RepID=A0A0N4ZKY7_PARTI